MGRFLTVLFISWAFTLTSCAPVRPSGTNAPDINVCAKIGGMHDERCIVDSYALVSFPRKYCGIIVSTIGYVDKNFVGVNFYPDETRAKYLQITGTVAFDEEHEAILSAEIDRHGGGIYVAVIARFSCGEYHAHDQVGVGSFSDVVVVSTYDFDEDGKFVAMRPLISDPDVYDSKGSP